LDKLRQYGESISDQQVEEARQSVKSEDVLYHIFSSVCLFSKNLPAQKLLES